MLAQLIRRDTVWKDMRHGLALCAVLSALPPVWGMDFGAMYGPLYVFAALFVGMPQRRATVFEGALPIPARSLFLARAASIIGVIWLTAAVAILSNGTFRGFGDVTRRILATAALCTLGGAALLCFRLRYLTGPIWLLAGAWVCSAVSFLIRNMPAAVPLACVAVGIGLIALAWKAVPPSFQIPPAPSIPFIFSRGATLPALTWMPVIRSVVSPAYVLWCFQTAFVAFIGSWLGAGVTILLAWVTARMQTRWLYTLPVRPRGLLVAIIGPQVALSSFAYFLSFHIGRHGRHIRAVLPPPAQILEIGAMLAWLLLITLIAALPSWRPLKRHRGVAWTIAGLIAAGCFISFLTGMRMQVTPASYSSDPLLAGVRRLAGAFSGSWGAALEVTVILLVALWWALEKVVSQSEYPDRPQRSQPWQ